MSLKDLRVPLVTRLTPLALAAGLAFAPGARAEDLVELYNAARAFDAPYLAARALADSAEYRAAQANALRLPSVNASAVGSAAESTSNVSQPILSADGRIIGSQVVRVTNDPQQGGVTVTGRQPLFNRANDATIAQAQKALESSRHELETAEQDLIVRVAQAYFDVLAAQDTLTTTRANRTAITEQLASAKRNFEVGTATITDTREAQARFDLATAQEIAAENDLRTKRIALDQLVGRANVQPNPLATTRLPEMAGGNVEQWVGTADQVHPAIQRARIGYDVAKLETQKARAAGLPTVDLNASVNNNYLRHTGNSNNAAVNVTVAMPLFAGFAIQNRIKETTILEEKSREDLEATRRSVAQATRQVWFGVQSTEAQVKALEAAEASSKLALEATQLGYRVGVRVNLDVLNAQTQLFQTQAQLAKARYDVLMGGLRLRQASGQLKPQDLSLVNTVLTK